MTLIFPSVQIEQKFSTFLSIKCLFQIVVVVLEIWLYIRIYKCNYKRQIQLIIPISYLLYSNEKSMIRISVPFCSCVLIYKKQRLISGNPHSRISYQTHQHSELRMYLIRDRTYKHIYYIIYERCVTWRKILLPLLYHHHHHICV